MALTNEQIERYSRHILLKEVGVRGQKKLLGAKVLVIGAGGLGGLQALDGPGLVCFLFFSHFAPP